MDLTFMVRLSPNLQRSCARIVAAGFVLAARGGDVDLVSTWGDVVDALNLPLYREWEEDINVALENIKNRLKYSRLDDHGPKLGKITRKSVFLSVFYGDD
jgi:glycogen debranching enzyme